MAREKSSSGFAVFIILAGIAILLFNMDMLHLDMFWGIVHLWPLLLIVAGLSILFRKVRHIDVVLWLVFFGIVIAYSYLNVDQKSWTIGVDVESVDYTTEAKGVESGIIDLDVATGSIKIKTNDDDQFNYSLPDTKYTSHTVNQYGSEFQFKVDDNTNDFGVYFNNRKYDLNIPNSGIWDIKIDGAVIDSEIDLTDVKARDVNINFAVGDIRLDIEGDHQSLYDIDFAIGNVILDIPNDANARVYYNGAISSIDVPEGYIKNGDYYYSENFDESKDYLDIRVDLAIGNVEIK